MFQRGFLRRGIQTTGWTPRTLMRIHTLDCELLTSGSIGETFRFFEDPRNLAKITPPGMGFDILSSDMEMRSGLEIEYKVLIFGFPARWKSVITEYLPPFSFVDEAVRSPYALWRHRHVFRATAEGTVVSDHVDYALPFPPFGDAAHFLVARELRRIFGYRQQTISRFLGGRTTQLKEPVIG